MTDELPQPRSERGRLRAPGKSTDDDRRATLLLVQELDYSWTFHGLGAPGVRVSEANAIGLAQAILKRAATPGDDR